MRVEFGLEGRRSSSRAAACELLLLCNGTAPAKHRDRASRDQEAERDPWTQYAITLARTHPQKAHEYRGITLVNQTATSGVQVRSTRRQSMPSRSIESCARLSRTVPLSAFGQMNRPRSRRLANRQRPSPSHHKKFYDVASAPAEHEDMSGEWLLLEHGLHLRTQTVETTAHIGHAGGDPDLRSCAEVRSLAQTLKNRSHQ